MHYIIDTLLLLALPASGKSEVRRYLALLDDETRRRDLCIGKTAQLDDFPYVHLMGCLSAFLRAEGLGDYFFAGADQPWADQREWLTLIEMLNEDYDDLLAHRRLQPPHAGGWMLERIEAASRKAGFPARLAALPEDIWERAAEVIDVEAAALLAELNQTFQTPEDGRTVVIEFARGGPEGSAMPIPYPQGYKHSLAQLSPEILSRAAILYVWVTPDESRRKNRERANPDDPGSILNHGVPEVVMRNEYGCDDMDYLEKEHPGLVRIQAHGRTWDIPIARFDNRDDKTTFLRADKADWPPEKLAALQAMFTAAMQALPGLRME